MRRFEPGRRGAAAVLAATCALLLAQFLWLWNSYYGGVGFHGDDGQFYYAWLRSYAIDGDVDFRNELTLHDPLGHVSPKRFSEFTPAGLLENRTGIGVAVMWSPFFAVSALASRMAGLPVDGYNPVFQLVVPLGSLVYGFAALVLAYRICRLHFQRLPSLIGTLGVTLGTTLGFLFVHFPILSHLPATFVTTLFLWVAFRTAARRTTGHWLLLGALIGLLGMVRYTAVIVAVVLPVQYFLEVANDRDRALAGLRRYAIGAVLVCAAATVAFVPQLLAWKALFGAYVVNSYQSGDDFMDFSSPHAIDSLVSWNHGLIAWTPLAGIGLIGLLLVLKRSPVLRLAVPLVAFTAIHVYLIGCITWWNFAEVFGNRGYSEIAAPLAFGLAALAAAFPRTILAATIVLIVTNQSLIWAWQNGMIVEGYGDIVRGHFYVVLRLAGLV